MRAWLEGDSKTLRNLTARNFRMLVGSRPTVLLDAKSWLESATDQFCCDGYRFGDIYARDLGPVAIFASQLELKSRIDGHDWSGAMWVTDIWKKSGVRRNWRMVERVLSRPEQDGQVAPAIRALQLWQRPLR